MAEQCECGERIFLGEVRCPACEAKARGAGGYHGTGAAPEGGASLIVRHGVASQEAGRDRGTTVPFEKTAGAVGMFTGMGGYMDPESTIDEVSRAMKVERDAHGNVIWDWKNALVGGIVVAVVVGFVIWYIAARLTMMGVDVAPHP